LQKGLVTGIELDEESKPTFCESCKWGKKHRKPIQKVREDPKPKAVGDEVHSDLWGKAPVKTINGREFALTFIDGCSSHTRVFLMRMKDETLDSYKTYEAWIKTQYDIVIKTLHTDRGGEYMSNAFSEHLQKAGTIRRLTVHDTPEYNGVAERFNRTVIEKVHALLHETGLPKFLWGEALHHVVYLNRTWTRTLPNTTPHEILTGKKLDLSNIHPWGTRVWVHDTKGSKLDGRAKEGRWVGFDEESRGHCIYWEAKGSVTVERSVTFVPAEVDIRIGNVPVEGEMEDFDEILEEVNEGNQPIPPEMEHPANDLELRNLLMTKFSNPLNMSNLKLLPKRIPEGEESESGKNLHMFDASRKAREVRVVEKEALLFQKDTTSPGATGGGNGRGRGG
jgi:transposase InsO family protein